MIQLQIRIILTIPNRIVYELAGLIYFNKFELVLGKLTQYKNLKLNGAFLNVLKLVNKENKRILYQFIKDQIEDNNLMHEQWTKSRLVLLPKKGDLNDLDN